METVLLPHLAQYPLHIGLFKAVKNATFLRQQLLDGNTDFEYTFLDASVALSRDHVFAACFRAINDLIHNRLKSKNVHSEIVFSLSPNSNISESFKRFGVSDTSTHVLAIKVGGDLARAEQHLRQSVEGDMMSCTDAELERVHDDARIKKAYRIDVVGHEAAPYVQGMMALKGS